MRTEKNCKGIKIIDTQGFFHEAFYFLEKPFCDEKCCMAWNARIIFSFFISFLFYKKGKTQQHCHHEILMLWQIQNEAKLQKMTYWHFLCLFFSNLGVSVIFSQLSFNYSFLLWNTVHETSFTPTLTPTPTPTPTH